jgi:aryl-alcohol dehydrogenase-like predicted oxidoreductase
VVPSDARRDAPIFQPDNVRRLRVLFRQALEPVARAHNASVPQLCLAWLLHQPGVAAVLVGASSAEQARQSARAMELEFTGDELAEIRRGFERTRIDHWAGRGGRPAQAIDLARRAVRKARRLIG